MPARVNKVLLLSIVGVVLVVVVAFTVVMFMNRNSATRLTDLRQRAEEYHAKGDATSEMQTLARYLVSVPNDVEIRTRLAKLLEDQGQVGRAYNEYVTLAALDPTNVAVLLKLAYWEGRLYPPKWAEMKRHAKAVTETQPKNVEALVRVAEACLGNGPDEYNEALENAKLAVQYDPSNVDAHRVLGRAFLARQDFAEARKAYEKATEALPQTSEIWSDIARFHLRMGEKPEAENALLSALRFAKDPVNADIELGMYYLSSRKDYASALKYFKAACDNATTADDRHAAFGAFGDYWASRDNATMALKQYDEALYARPNATDVLLRKAQVFLSLKQYDQASAAIDKVKGLGMQDRVNVMAIYLDAERLLLQDRPAEAVRQYEAAIQMLNARDLKMPSADLYLGEAKAYLKLENLPAAKDALGKAYSEAPGDPRILMAFARVLLATREYDQVISILEIPTKPVEAYQVLAGAYLGRGGDSDVREARVQLAKALSARPNDVGLHLDMARAAARQHVWDQAVTEADNAIRLKGNYVDAWLTKALIQDVAGRTKDAETTFRSAVEKNPDVLRLRMAWARYPADPKKLNRFDEAERMLLDDYGSRPAGGTLRAEYASEIPRFYLATGKIDKALEWYLDRSKADAKDVEGRVAASLILLSSNRVDEARKLIGEIRDIEGATSLRAMKLEAQALVMKREYRDALQKLLEVEKADPRDFDMQYYIGYSYLRTARLGTDDAAKAKTYLDRVGAQFPTNSRVKRAQIEADYTVGDYATAYRMAMELMKAGEQGLDLEVIQHDYDTRFGKPFEGETGWRQFTKDHPERLEGWIGLAEALLRQDKASEARETLEKAYQLDPKRIDTISLLANLYRSLKEYDKAVDMTKKALETDPTSLTLLGILAQLYETQGKSDLALATYEQIGKLDPNNPMPAVAEALKALANKDLPAAERAFRRAFDLRPRDPTLRQRYLEILVAQNKFADARAVVDKAMRDDPNDGGLVVLQAQLRLAEGDAEGSIRQYRQGIKAARDRGAEMQNVGLYFEMGRVLAGQGRITEAMTAFETARDLKPDFLEARMALVEIAVKSQPPRLQDARSECLRIVQTKPNLLALLTLGDIERVDGKFAEAKTYYDRAVTAFPNESEPLRKRAEMMLHDKKLDGALVELKRAVALDKHEASSVGLVADVLVSNKRHDEAVAFLKDELTSCPEPARLWLFMGNVEATRKDYVKAREDYDRSLGLRGDDPQVYMAKARAYLAERSFDRAVDEAREALKVDSKYELGWIFQEAVYREESRSSDLKNLYEAWRRALPDSVVAANNYAWFLTEKMDDADGALKVLESFRERLAAAGAHTAYAAELDDTEGYAWFKKGRYREAIEAFKHSIEQRTGSARTWEHLRLAYVKMMERAKEQNDPPAVVRWQREAEAAYNHVLENAQPSFESMSQIADMRLAEGKVKDAIEAYNAALALKKDAAVQRKLGELLIRDGRLDDATKLVADLMAQDPKEPQNLSLEGMLLSARGRSDEAVSRFEAVLRDTPKYTSAHYLLAMEYAGRGENEKAKAELDTVTAQSPQFLGARLVKARILAVEKKFDEAIVECQAVLKGDPMNFEAGYNMGNFYLQLNKTAEAEATFKDLVKKWPDSVLAHERLAETFRKTNRLGEAVIEYRDARRTNPKELVLLRGMCNVLEAQNKRDAVVTEYKSFLEENPGNTDAWVDLAKIYAASEQWTDGERALKSAVRTAGANPAVHVLLIDFYLGRQMNAEARAAAKRLIDEVGSADAKAIGHTAMARSWENEDHVDDAVAEYRAALAANKGHLIAVNNLAWLLLTRKKDPDAAIATGEPYLKTAENFVALYDTVGWAYRTKGDFVRAEPILKHAIAVMMLQTPDRVNPAIAYHYGEVLYKLGKTEDAKKQLEFAASRTFPDQQKAQELLKKLE